MRYYKNVEDGYIMAIGTGGGGVEITESEYNTIMSVIHNKPPRTGTTDYHLKTDLTWDEYEREQEPVDESELDPQDALDLIFGGVE